MKIYVNGEIHECAEHSRVADVIAELGLTGKRIAVELNKEILPFRPIRNPGIAGRRPSGNRPCDRRRPG